MVLMRGWFRSFYRCLPLVALFLNGCAVIPGMYASYSKPAEVIESEEEPDSSDYTLLKVTPLLIKQLNEAVARSQFSVKGKLPASKTPSYPYRIGPQDVLTISVWGYEEFSGSGTGASAGGAGSGGAGSGRIVDSRGYVYLPLVGGVKLQGQTINEARVVLKNAYANFVKDPQIEVSVVGYRSQRVFVAGAVGTPGVVPLTDQPLTLVDALSQAGGLSNDADFYNVTLTRGDSKVSLNVDRLYYDGDMSINLLLQNNDVISVPDGLDRKVFILGEVGNAVSSSGARAYVMRRGRMSLTEVLSDAGGLNPFSSASSQVYILRANPEIASPTQAASNFIVYQMAAGDPSILVLADQFPMQPRDVVFVNPTGPTRIGRFISQFLPIYGTALTVTENPY